MIGITNTRIGHDIARQSALAGQVARTQIEISTGKKVQLASDDPVASARLATIRQSQSDHEAWASNIALGQSLSDQADSVFATVNERMARAREALVGGANGTASAADRATLASELRDIAAELDDLARTKASTGSSLFSSNSALRFRMSETDLIAPVPSRADLFEVNGTPLSQIVSDAADALLSGNTAVIGQSLSILDAAVAKAADSAAKIGLSAGRMARIKEQQIDAGVALTAERSGLEDSDLNEAIARLNQQTLTLDAARAAFARINRQTLFDLIN